MKFTFKPSPNYRDKQSTHSIMIELAIGLLVVFGFSVFYYFTEYGSQYGIRAIGLLITAIVSALATEAIWYGVTKKNVIKEIKNSFPLITAIILTLMVSINTSYYALVISTVVAILFGKLVFGGFGQNVFNPAALGRAVLMSSFAGSVAADFATGATPTAAYASAGWMSTSQAAFDTFVSNFGGMSNMFVGFYPGSLGETSALVIILVGIYLAIRKVIDWRVPVTYIASMFVLTFIVGAMHGQGLYYPLFHLLSGGALFGAVFMMTDPVTNPTSASGRIIFAIGCAILTIVIRLKANLPEGVLYSILLMNMLTPAIERWTDGNQIKMVKKNISSICIVGIVGILSVVACGLSISAKETTGPVAGGEAGAGGDLALGNPASFGDDYSRYDAKVEEIDAGVYLVKVKGYGLLDPEGHAGASGIDYQRNEFEIKVVDGKIESIKNTVFGDTPGFGDKATGDDYLNIFKDFDITNMDQEIDTVTTATWTSKSIIAAIKATNPDATSSESSEEETPSAALGNPVSLNDDYTRFDAKVESSGDGVYSVRVKGYGLIDPEGHAGESGIDYARNEFEITITDGKVVSITNTVFGDTPGFGDKATGTDYLEIFAGIDATLEQEIDTVTSATWTSESVIAAIQAAINAANE